MKPLLPINLFRSSYLKAVLIGAFAFSFGKADAQYCTSSFTNVSFEHITNVTFVSINNSTAGVTPNNNFTAMVANVSAGATYPLSVSILPDALEYIYAFIDWDQNGTLNDPGEVYIVAANTSSAGPHTINVTVPATAKNGSTLMRVILDFNGTTPNPCRNSNYGEVEDYTVLVLPKVPDDGGIEAITSPGGACDGTYDVKAIVRNFGSNEITSITVNWEVNGAPQTPYIHSTSLDTTNGFNPDRAEVTLGQVTLTAGTKDTIKIWTSDVNNTADTVYFNDTLYKYTDPLPTISNFPYVEDFENGEGSWFSGGANNTWAFGTPAKPTISGASSGINAWVVGGLTGIYNGDEASWVNSPCFDFSEFEGDPWVALDVNWASETSFDGAILMSSIDGGKTWQKVGKYQDPHNWYNEDQAFGAPGGQEEAWCGSGTNSSGGWKKAKHILPSNTVGKQLQFRLVFGSDASVNQEGFAFDNFILVDFKQANLGPDKRSLCGKPNLTLDPNVNFAGDILWITRDEIAMMNDTLDTLETYGVTKIGKYWVIYTDSLIGEVTSDTIEIVQSTPPSINFGFSVDSIPLQGQVTIDPHTSFDLAYSWTPSGYNFPYLLVKGSELGVGAHIITLNIQDSLLCEDTKSVTIRVFDITGIDERAEDGVHIYPNPVKDRLNVLVVNPTSQKTDVRIFDMKGSLLYGNSYPVGKGGLIEIDMNNLDPGTYILQVGYGEDMITKKVVKQ